ncbi:hypothetical protein Dsin_005629 [Dipteronia sinensis]|uniref:J domain-containing protein n=1 Tax=Dipteronia sinensis TaxID=43782 RepID=A0AAE0AX72_9ROSI|nr:hypothetical protein Dsin_005629 [Dipteronia sinensis]
MTEVLLDMAEEHYLKGNTVSAFKWASLAQELDPNFGSVNLYVEAYRINLAAFIIHPNGERNWYRLLDIEQHSVSCQAITHRFVKLAKMIDPEVHSSAAAPTALKHITMAWENLGEPDKRCAYHARVGLPPPTLEKPQPQLVKPQLEKPLEIGSKKRSRLETHMEIASKKRCSSSHPSENTSQKRCQVNSSSHPSEIASQKRCSSSHPPENTSHKRCQVDSSSHPPKNASQKRCRIKSSSHHVNRHRVIF